MENDETSEHSKRAQQRRSMNGPYSSSNGTRRQGGENPGHLHSRLDKSSTYLQMLASPFLAMVLMDKSGLSATMG